MDILEEIKELKEEKLTKYVYEKINKLEEETNVKNENSKIIGYLLDYNPSVFDLSDKKTTIT